MEHEGAFDPFAAPIAGNAHDDHNIWNALYAIADDDTKSPAERARAIRHMDKLTGENDSKDLSDEQLVTEYVRETEMWRNK